MNRITSYFVKHPVVFWSVVAGIIVAGVLSFIMMPKLEDPPISAKQAMVVVSYPGLLHTRLNSRLSFFWRMPCVPFQMSTRLLQPVRTAWQ